MKVSPFGIWSFNYDCIEDKAGLKWAAEKGIKSEDPFYLLIVCGTGNNIQERLQSSLYTVGAVVGVAFYIEGADISEIITTPGIRIIKHGSGYILVSDILNWVNTIKHVLSTTGSKYLEEVYKVLKMTSAKHLFTDYAEFSSVKGLTLRKR
jgi:hypothetical protein